MADKGLFVPEMDGAELCTYKTKTHTVHCCPSTTAKPKFTNPRRQGLAVIRRKCRFFPSRRQRKEARMVADIIRNERTWMQ